jgi:hypothetical protein
MKLIVKCASHELSPNTSEWSFVKRDAPPLRARAAGVEGA